MSDAEDAARWRALMNCRRMSFMGSAGFGHGKPGEGEFPDPRDYRHMTINFWSVMGPDYSPDGSDENTKYCRDLLMKFTDAVLRMEALNNGHCETDSFVVFEGAPHLPVLLKGVIDPTDAQIEMARRRVEDAVGELEEDDRFDFPTFDVYRAVQTGGG